MKKVYFIGIGGIGVSALAQWYLSEGWGVYGSDASASVVTASLTKMGAKITIGQQKGKAISKQISLVIYSAAIGEDHAEREKATLLRIPQMSYAEALGKLVKRYKTVAISGAHGKSTTTSLVALMLVRAGFDPTVIVGTRLKEFGNANFRKGESEWLVLEADEYHRSFLHYCPFIAICTNIDREHLDYYKSFAAIQNAFRLFFSHVSSCLILNKEDKALKKLSLKTKVPIHTYGTKGNRSRHVKTLLRVPGRHNHSNVMASDALGEILRIPQKVRDAVFSNFTGTWRRFEFKGTVKRIPVYDDYAHHPSEIRATLQGMRERYPHRRIICIFQPHHEERLRLLFSDFTRSFRDADVVVIVETYRVLGRSTERELGSVNANALAEAIGKKATYVRNSEEAFFRAKNLLQPTDALVVMGAGDIWKVTEKLVEKPAAV